MDKKWVRSLKDYNVKNTWQIHNKYITNIQSARMEPEEWLRKADQLPFIPNNSKLSFLLRDFISKTDMRMIILIVFLHLNRESGDFQTGSTMFNLWAWIATKCSIVSQSIWMPSPVFMKLDWDWEFRMALPFQKNASNMSEHIYSLHVQVLPAIKIH